MRLKTKEDEEEEQEQSDERSWLALSPEKRRNVAGDLGAPKRSPSAGAPASDAVRMFALEHVLRLVPVLHDLQRVLDLSHIHTHTELCNPAPER